MKCWVCGQRMRWWERKHDVAGDGVLGHYQCIIVADIVVRVLLQIPLNLQLSLPPQMVPPTRKETVQ